MCEKLVIYEKQGVSIEICLFKIPKKNKSEPD